MKTSVVAGQEVSNSGPDFSSLVVGLEGQQVGNIPTVVMQNWYKNPVSGMVLADNNHLFSEDGAIRYATVFAILDKDGKILLVNRAAQEQEIINDGADLSHAGATVHPISVHYKLGQMQNPMVFSVLGAKIQKVEFTTFAVEEVNGDAEKECIMSVYLVYTDFDSSGISGFYNLDEIKGKTVTAKVAAAIQKLSES